MDNAATAWVVSRSSKPELALADGNIVEICVTGPDPRADASSYARDETLQTGRNTYVYAVELTQTYGYKLHKEVRGFVPAE